MKAFHQLKGSIGTIANNGKKLFNLVAQLIAHLVAFWISERFAGDCLQDRLQHKFHKNRGIVRRSRFFDFLIVFFLAVFDDRLKGGPMNLKMIDPALQAELEILCQQNGWLRKNGYDFQDGLLLEPDYPYRFHQVDSLDDLRSFFAHGNWPIRQGILYHDLVFINQVNGGDEWWTARRFGDHWTAFESITFRSILQDGEFDAYIKAMEVSSEKECLTLDYHPYTQEEIEALAQLFEAPPTPRVTETPRVVQASYNGLFSFFKQNSLHRFYNRDWGDLADDDKQRSDYNVGCYLLSGGASFEDEEKLLIMYDGTLILLCFPSDPI